MQCQKFYVSSASFMNSPQNSSSDSEKKKIVLPSFSKGKFFNSNRCLRFIKDINKMYKIFS